MSGIKSITRGCKVKFGITFYDYNRSAIQPSTAFIRLTYNLNKVLTSNTLPLTYDANSVTYTAEWDTTGIDLGTIDWHVWTTSIGTVAEDGQLVITGNRANQ